MDDVYIDENREGYSVKIGSNPLAYLLKERFNRSDAEQLKTGLETAYACGHADGKEQGYDNGYEDGERDASTDAD